MARKHLIRVRRDTDGNWTSADPTLADGELGLVTDEDLLVVGDGATAYTGLGDDRKLATRAHVDTVASYPNPPAGNYVWTPATSATTGAYPEGQIRLIPFFVGRTLTIDRIACDVTSAGAAGAVVRMGIYADNGSDVAGSLVVDGGTAATTTTGVKTVTVSQTLSPGLYWLGAVSQGGASTPATLRTAAGLVVPFFTNIAFDSASSGRHSVFASGVTGALPDPFVSAGWSNQPPLVALRVA